MVRLRGSGPRFKCLVAVIDRGHHHASQVAIQCSGVLTNVIWNVNVEPPMTTMILVLSETASKLPTPLVQVGSFLSDLVSQAWVTFILVPVIATAGAMLLKVYAKPDPHVNADDWLWGFDLGLTACITLLLTGFFLVNTPESSRDPLETLHYLIGLFVVLFVCVVLLIFGALMMSKKGWKEDTNGENNNQKKIKTNWVWGINFGGAFLLVIAFILSGGGAK